MSHSLLLYPLPFTPLSLYNLQLTFSLLLFLHLLWSEPQKRSKSTVAPHVLNYLSSIFPIRFIPYTTCSFFLLACSFFRFFTPKKEQVNSGTTCSELPFFYICNHPSKYISTPLLLYNLPLTTTHFISYTTCSFFTSACSFFRFFTPKRSKYIVESTSP